jgi:hypothetical protein
VLQVPASLTSKFLGLGPIVDNDDGKLHCFGIYGEPYPPPPEDIIASAKAAIASTSATAAIV